MIYVLFLLTLISSTLAEVFTVQIFAQSSNPDINGLAVIAQNQGSPTSIYLSNTTTYTTMLAYDTNTSLLLYQSGGSTYYLDTINGTLMGVPLSNTNANLTMILLNSTDSLVTVQCNNETVAGDLGFSYTANYSTVLDSAALAYGSTAFPIYVSPDVPIYSNEQKVSYKLVYKRMNSPQPTLGTSAVVLLTDSLPQSTISNTQTTTSASTTSLKTTSSSTKTSSVKAAGQIIAIAPISVLSAILLSIL